ncbi:putative RNA recognition motif domain, nucleotide-binding alpha-beta plait domain superfamily [Helianthus annuus]|nr:putative RNA recognition motif domain, nucleotide-binding alpha-beta plait domain superfamily [Helianthus annuus]KAJ0432893.1 putative RNA recognition motif domain, nucleotide-binding alpha-beta plait domain superfamily [Helianthus annuus]KAJ0447063.1 putative RNA recognition motif domain, nucleotide-binding alpha-beta plait domain superfamily [Helianthus annuus]KAJ0631966.1 putative RNA recognition motif domain, nucleotide-binding alpha-beta plait domain superfamily [Helianthus annuus]KAJ06
MLPSGIPDPSIRGLFDGLRSLCFLSLFSWSMAGNITKFYVANIPEGCRPWDLATFLGKYGEIAGSFIARKRCKEGLKFSFVSFKGVKDWKELERNMQGLNLGGFKLKINRAKFAKENNVEEDRRPPPVKTQQPRKVSEETSGVSQESGEVSVVEVHSETSAFFDMHGRAVVGRVKDVETLVNLKALFKSSVVLKFKFYYLGGLNIMVEFEDDLDTTEFILNVQLWKEWFDSLDVWSGQTMAYERIAWLKFHGVPLHLAENKDLSSSCVGIFVDSGARICGSSMISWRNKKFKVWVLEELDDWIPDCMFDDESMPSYKVNDEGGTEVNMPDSNEEVKDLNNLEKEHEDEKDKEGSEDSSDEDEGFSDESDSDFSDKNGDQGDMPPEIPTLVSGNEQSTSFNFCGVQQESFLGKSNDGESVQVPNMGCCTVNTGGDTGNIPLEGSGRICSLSSFKSDFNLGRPTFGARRLKPRKCKTSRCVTSSPSSDHRPRKRSRDDTKFSFDLNKEAGDNYLASLAADPQYGNRANLVTSDVHPESPAVTFSPQIGAGLQSGREAGDVSTRIEVSDTVISPFEKEVRETISLGKIVGVNLEIHSDLVRESIRSEGINEMDP